MKTIAFVAIFHLCLFAHVMGFRNFGANMKNNFRLNKKITFLNHGGRGAVPNGVFMKKLKLMRELEDNPDLWFRETETSYYMKTVEVAAEFVGGKKENLVIVDNASTGIGTAIDNLDLRSGDGILIMDQTYRGVVMKATQMKDKKGTETVVVSSPFPLKSEEDFLTTYKEALENNANVKLAIIDHITGPSGTILPIKKLTKLCHQYNVTVIIDGAHAPGQIEVNVEDIGADFYVGNFYKWAYASHSCAFLYISPPYNSHVQPLITSNNYNKSLQLQFQFLGARDNTNFFTLERAFQFIKNCGGVSRIHKYTRTLLNDAKMNITRTLRTIAAPIPESMRAPGMLVIVVPTRYDGEGSELNKLFLEKYKINALFMKVLGQVWVRIMANVYNAPEDYIHFQTSLADFVRTQNEVASQNPGL